MGAQLVVSKAVMRVVGKVVKMGPQKAELTVVDWVETWVVT